MPSDTALPAHHGRCYCGALCVSARAEPLTVAYCHCSDCKRWTGAPLPAFAAFRDQDIVLPDTSPRSFAKGVFRWICPDCGSPLAAKFDYLPGQTYIPLGVLESAADLAPQIHCHAEAQLPWLHLSDDLPRAQASGRDTLNASGTPCR